MTTTLLLARHAVTPANTAKPYILQARKMDFALSELGLAQADRLADALSAWPISAVYVSPLVRSRTTGEAVAKRHGVAVHTVPELTEVDIGVWEGLTWPAIAEQWPAEKQRFDADPEIHPYLGGESYGDVRDRCVPAIIGLVERHRGETIAVIGHNGVNRAVLAAWLGLPIALCRRLPQANAGYSVVEFEGDQVHVRTINVVRHLAGLTADT